MISVQVAINRRLCSCTTGERHTVYYSGYPVGKAVIRIIDLTYHQWRTVR